MNMKIEDIFSQIVAEHVEPLCQEIRKLNEKIDELKEKKPLYMTRQEILEDYNITLYKLRQLESHFKLRPVSGTGKKKQYVRQDVINVFSILEGKKNLLEKQV